MSILDEIIKNKKALPKKQQQLCNYILENPHDIHMTTVKTLASNASVGTTTVLRLVKFLGYDSYPEFKMQFHTLQNEYISKWENVKKSFSNQNDVICKNTIEEVWNEAIVDLNNSINPQLIMDFTQAIECIINSKRLFVFGARPYKATAIYLELLLNEFYTNIFQLSNDSESMFDKLLHSNADDVVILFGFEPYTKRSVSLAKLAAKNLSKIILISDVLSNPISPYATVNLQLKVSSNHYSIIPVFTLIESLVLEVGKKTSNKSIDLIKQLSPILKEADVIY